jgi:lipoprotein LprG
VPTICTVRLASTLALLAVFACSSGQPAPAPATLLRDSGQAMGKLTTVSADLKFTAGKIQLQGFTLDSASTKVRLPADSDTTFKVKQGDFLVNVRVVATGGKVYIQLPFSSMQELTPAEASTIPNFSTIFDATRGLPALLGEGRSPVLQGSEQVDGVDSYKVATSYTADQIGTLMGGLKPGGDVSAVFWIGQSDKLVRKAILTGDFDQSGSKATLQVHVHDFDKPVQITPPAASPAA